MKKIREYFGSSWDRTREFVVHNILHADDPPHRMALGVGFAMFVTFTPTIGFQMGLVFAICWLFGGNKLVGLPLVWISNPATIVPIYYPCLWVGEALLGQSHRNFAWFKTMFSGAPEEWLPKISFFGNALKDIALELWLGCIVIGGVLGVISYFVTYQMVYSYRMRVWGQLTPPPHHHHSANTDPSAVSTPDQSTDTLDR